MNIFTDLSLSGLDRMKVSFIRSGIADGLSGLSILRSLQASPLGGMRKTTFFKIVRTIKKVELQRPYIKSVRKDRNFDPNRLVESPYNHKKAFNYIVHGKIRDAETGEEKHTWVTVSSSVQFKPEEALAIGEYLIRKGDSWGTDNSLDVDLENIYLGTEYEG